MHNGDLKTDFFAILILIETAEIVNYYKKLRV